MFLYEEFTAICAVSPRLHDTPMISDESVFNRIVYSSPLLIQNSNTNINIMLNMPASQCRKTGHKSNTYCKLICRLPLIRYSLIGRLKKFSGSPQSSPRLLPLNREVNQ